MTDLYDTDLGEEYHKGFAAGLMYALAQCNNGEPTMTITIPDDETDFKLEVFQRIFDFLNVEAHVADFKAVHKKHWIDLTIATTENEKPLPEGWHR